MAQMYLPEHPCEREQLQSNVSAPDVTLAQSVEERGIFRLEEEDAGEEA